MHAATMVEAASWICRISIIKIKCSVNQGSKKTEFQYEFSILAVLYSRRS